MSTVKLVILYCLHYKCPTMAAKQKNDAKDSELGNNYRTLIALSYCMKLAKGEKIVIEKYGDISIFGLESSKQIEVKHHIRSNSLGDGHEELWNTIYNWHKEDSSLFDELILHTTSHLPIKSAFKFWHAPNTTADVRHHILKHSCTATGEEFKRLQALIFDDAVYPETKRKEIISKITLSTKQPNYETKLNSLKDDPFFAWIKEDELKISVIKKLLGEINALNRPNSDWEITRELFDKLVQEIKVTYDNSPSSLILEARIANSPEVAQRKMYRRKQFVKAIECLECDDDEIDEAIVDYWRFTMAYKDFLDVHPTFNDNTFKHYKKEIIHKKLKRHSRLETAINDKMDKKLLSQIIYKKALAMSPIDFGLLRPNIEYFQNGTMHDLVEDGDFKWMVD